MLLRLFISFLALTAHSLTSSALAQPYVLNPYHQTKPSLSLQLSQADENKWLQTFYKKVPVLVTLDRFQIKDENGESLDQKIKSATQQYLELHHDQAESINQEALELLSNSLPYDKIIFDLTEVIALKLMISKQGIEELPDEARPLFRQREFLEKLPLKVQAQIREREPPTAHSLSSFGLKCVRLWVNGAETFLPGAFVQGRYLLHCLNNSELEARWLSIDGRGVPTSELLWSRSLWHLLPISALREHLEGSRPKQLPRGGISILTKEGPPLLISDSWEAQKLKLPEPKVELAPFEKDFMKDSEESLESSASLFKSPWFWIVTTVAAGTAGYFIYDATQTKTATSP